MKKVILKTPLNRGGEIIPKDSFLCLADEEAENLVKNGNAKLVENAEEGNDGNGEKEIIIEKLKTAELEELAKDLQVDISGCKNNKERVALIKEAQEKAKETGGNDGSNGSTGGEE